MNIDKVCSLLGATEVTKIKDLDLKFCFGFSSDLMSDVLTVDVDSALLITGLATVQSIRTSDMADIQLVVLARGKRASSDMIELAEECDIMILESELSTFHVSAILFAEGVKPIY